MQESFFTTEKEMRDKFFVSLENGEKKDCPCCGRYSQIYKRKISQSMVISMAKCYRLQQENDGAFVHHAQFIPHAGCGFHDLKYFDMIIPKMHDLKTEANKRTSGYWRVTQKGISFLHDLIAVPKYVLIFDDTLLGVTGDPVRVANCLEENFNYQELMRAA